MSHLRLWVAILVFGVILPAAAEDWKFEIKVDPADAAKVLIQLKGAAPTADTLPAVTLLSNVEIECTTPADCTNVSVDVGGTPLTGLTGDARKKSGTINSQRVKANDQVVVKHPNGTRTFKATAPVAQAPPSPSVTANIPLAELLQTQCPITVSGSGYNRAGNEATFIVNALGNTFLAPTENIDENDKVNVTVFADKRLLPLLRIRRKSEFRSVTSFNIVGAGLTVPVAQLAQAETEPCGSFTIQLRDFAPGKGEVEILAQVGDRQVPTGSFEFGVNPLYEGMFSLGTITSDLTDRTFGLTQKDGKNIIVAQQEGETTLYTVMYTPFIFEPRDIRKPMLRGRFYQHFNPVFGITLTEIGKHAIGGVSFDYGGFVLSVGEHFARVNVLSATSGLEEGSPFTGQASEIPTAKKWDHDHFIGFSIDLRAAVQLLRTVIGTGTPSTP